MTGIIEAINATSEKSINSSATPYNLNGDYKRLFEQKKSLTVDFSANMNTLKIEEYSVTKYSGNVSASGFRGVFDMNYILLRDSVLSRAVWNLVSISRFKNEYIDMLQEFIPIRSSKKVSERYKEIALKHISDLRDGVDDGMIAHEAKILLDAAKVKMTSDEIGDILSLDVLSVEFALRKYSKKEAAELGDE